MPNGFHGSNEEWKTMEAPLLRMDPQLEQFAREHGLHIRKNYHNWPERSLGCHVAGIHKLISIAFDSTGSFTFSIVASQDRGDRRFWKQQILRKATTAEDIERELRSLLTEALRVLEKWNEADLEFSIELKG